MSAEAPQECEVRQQVGGSCLDETGAVFLLFLLRLGPENRSDKATPAKTTLPHLVNCGSATPVLTNPLESRSTSSSNQQKREAEWKHFNQLNEEKVQIFFQEHIENILRSFCVTLLEVVELFHVNYLYAVVLVHHQTFSKVYQLII